MTYKEAWAIYCNRALFGSDEYETAAEHVRLTDYDLAAGIIQSVEEYDA